MANIILFLVVTFESVSSRDKNKVNGQTEMFQCVNFQIRMGKSDYSCHTNQLKFWSKRLIDAESLFLITRMILLRVVSKQ